MKLKLIHDPSLHCYFCQDHDFELCEKDVERYLTTVDHFNLNIQRKNPKKKNFKKISIGRCVYNIYAGKSFLDCGIFNIGTAMAIKNLGLRNKTIWVRAEPIDIK